MKWLLTSTLSLILVLGGCSASALRPANASTTAKADAKTKIATATRTAKLTGDLFSNKNENITFLEESAIYNAKLTANSIRMGKMLAYVKTRVNRTPYVFSGDTIYGWDCSGMVRWFYQQGFGITLEHSATAQAKVGHRVSTPAPGDIVLFGWKGYTGFYHASIYVGNNKVINANNGAGTTIVEPLTDYKGSRIAYVRVVDTLYSKTS